MLAMVMVVMMSVQANTHPYKFYKFHSVIMIANSGIRFFPVAAGSVPPFSIFCYSHPFIHFFPRTKFITLAKNISENLEIVGIYENNFAVGVVLFGLLFWC